MRKQILFIQGGGDRGYEIDRALVDSLKSTLGENYVISYPEIKSNEYLPDFGWTEQIGKMISETGDNLILAGHSFGASMLLKFLSENMVHKKFQGIFLIATPFWSGNENWQKNLKLKENFADSLPEKVPFFFYHCKDDEEVPFSHFERYKQKLKQAAFREIKTGGHQLNNDLTYVANDIKSLKF